MLINLILCSSLDFEISMEDEEIYENSIFNSFLQSFQGYQPITFDLLENLHSHNLLKGLDIIVLNDKLILIRGIPTLSISRKICNMNYHSFSQKDLNIYIRRFLRNKPLAAWYKAHGWRFFFSSKEESHQKICFSLLNEEFSKLNTKLQQVATYILKDLYRNLIDYLNNDLFKDYMEEITEEKASVVFKENQTSSVQYFSIELVHNKKEEISIIKINTNHFVTYFSVELKCFLEQQMDFYSFGETRNF